MQLQCEKCGTALKPENINVATDIAQCAACGNISKLSLLANIQIDSNGTTSTRHQPFDPTPPRGSKVILTPTGHNQLEITLPPKGTKGPQIFMAIFAIFWLSFVSVWTVLAATSSIIFAAFSIPFWIVGIFMLIGVFKSRKLIEKISFFSNRIEITSNNIFSKTKTIEIPLNEIDTVRMWSKMATINEMQISINASNTTRNGKSSYLNTPALFCGMQKYPFFQTADESEQYWIIGFTEEWLRKFKR
jgi:hypothetical protein